MIEKDYSKDNLFDELGMKRLKDSYMRNDENSPQDRFEFVANKFASNEEHAKRLYEYMSNHWLSCSTPILSYGKNKNNLPISCFLPWLEDTSKGLVDTFSEVSWLSMAGGGVGVGVGIRSADDKSVGIMPHLKTYDASMLAYKQGNRRGSYAMYLDISHPDIIQFIEMRKPTGDPLLRCQNLNHGINIPDEFMELIENVMKDENFDDRWELKDPNNGKVREVVSARYLWQKILETRMLTGEPMIHFISTSNKMMPEYQKKLGLKIRQSNLCFTGDTLVAITSHNGVMDCMTIKEMSEICDGDKNKKFSVYSGSYVGNFYWDIDINNAIAFKTGTKKVIELTLSNGKKFKCTPDHLLASKISGKYIEAKDSLNAELMSFQDHVYVNKIEQLEILEDVYDLTVENDHSFMIVPKDDNYSLLDAVLVHNCSEITLPTDNERTAVCCLSSLNLEYYDDWKDNDIFIRDVAEMLDNVLDVFINDAPDVISKAKFSAMRERSIGIGTLGFHAYLQKNNIPFESASAVGINRKIFKNIYDKGIIANSELSNERGEAPDAEGYGKRFSTMFAIAPNASSSIILGNTSPSVEPYKANAYRQDTISGFHVTKNRYLDKIIREESKNRDDDWYNETWAKIVSDDGSVRSLDWLDDWQKDVFKTFKEIDQRWVIQHAADRQQYIDQAQSINLCFAPDADIKYLHDVHFSAWKKGLKTLYYCRSSKMGKFEKISNKIERVKIEEENNSNSECLACQ